MKIVVKSKYSGEVFWDYSKRFYEYGKNKKSLLLLQDKAQLEVSLAIFCFYLLRQGYLCNNAMVHELVTETDVMHRRMMISREDRRESKPKKGCEDFGEKHKRYQRFLLEELEFEKIFQTQLLDHFLKLEREQFDGLVFVGCILNMGPVQLDYTITRLTEVLTKYFGLTTPTLSYNINSVKNAFQRMIIEEKEQVEN